MFTSRVFMIIYTVATHTWEYILQEYNHIDLSCTDVHGVRG